MQLLEKKVVLQILAPSCSSILKAQVVPLAWVFSPVREKYCTCNSQKHRRVFTAGIWTSEAGLRDDDYMGRISATMAI